MQKYQLFLQLNRTLIPRQGMDFPGHKYPNDTLSYPSHEHILKYLNSYADRFKLRKYIQLHHLVEKICSIENNKWNITIKDLPQNKIESITYDAVFVCINKYLSPNYPEIEGANKFNGKIMHSHDYRRPGEFLGSLRSIDVIIIFCFIYRGCLLSLFIFYNLT